MKKIIIPVISALLVFIAYFYFDNYNINIEKKDRSNIETKVSESEDKNINLKDETNGGKENRKSKNTEKYQNRKEREKNEKREENKIDELTAEKKVIAYLQENGSLPDYYINKKEARQNGWVSKKGNLCESVPGRAIGGDVFTNREKILPSEKGRIWYEADINYNCGRRNGERIVFSNDGLIFVTHNHYKSFKEVK